MSCNHHYKPCNIEHVHAVSNIVLFHFSVAICVIMNETTFQNMFYEQRDVHMHLKMLLYNMVLLNIMQQITEDR